jgi:hypothetical protein
MSRRPRPIDRGCRMQRESDIRAGCFSRGWEMLIYVEELKRSGRYKATLADGTVLLKSSRQPLLDGARALLAQGIDPETVLVMARKSAGTESLLARAGDAAKLTVQEGDRVGPRFVKWKPYPQSPADENNAWATAPQTLPGGLAGAPTGPSGVFMGPTALPGLAALSGGPIGPTGPAPGRL